jgi:exonuclease VII small subunit
VEYERGVELIRRCRAVLKRAEQRVEDLTDRMLAADDPVSAPPEHGGGGSGEGGAETPD